MRPVSPCFATLVITLAGAAWGIGLTLSAVEILVGQDGVYLPTFLAFGPLLLVTERVPSWVSTCLLAPIYYGVTAALLWNAGRNRAAAVAASLLYLLLLAGPWAGLTGHYWSPPKQIKLWEEVNKTYEASQELPWWFAALFVGLVMWHGFAWWLLGRFWCAAERAPVVRWLAAGTAAALYGAALSWIAMAHVGGHSCGHLPGMLVMGPVLLLDRLPNFYLDYTGFAGSTAVVYGVLGMLMAAAKDRRYLVWPALIAWGTFSLGVLGYLIWIEATLPGVLAEQWHGAGPALRAAPLLFLAVMAGLLGWQAYVVRRLWHAWSRPNLDDPSLRPEPRR